MSCPRAYAPARALPLPRELASSRRSAARLATHVADPHHNDSHARATLLRRYAILAPKAVAMMEIKVPSRTDIATCMQKSGMVVAAVRDQHSTHTQLLRPAAVRMRACPSPPTPPPTQ